LFTNLYGLNIEANRLDLILIMNRRQHLQAILSGPLVLMLPDSVRAIAPADDGTVKLGLIADVHHDLIHDAPERLKAFLKVMRRERPHATVQLGDFAFPKPDNQEVVNLFNQSSSMPLHVIGNHDMDNGHTKAQCVAAWGIPASYYAKDVQGIRLLILDGNQTGSPRYKGGYPSYIGPEQRAWLREELAQAKGPTIVISHQPLAGPLAVDDALEIQEILGEFANKVLLAINGHSHLDYLLRVRHVPYLHLNSASYYWVGEAYRHDNYPPEIMQKYPFAALTCPYRTCLFATLSIDPARQVLTLRGRQSTWVGDSPAQLGLDIDPEILPGEHITTQIRPREVERVR